MAKFNSTPLTTNSTSDASVATLAEAFAAGEIAKLGDFLVTRLENGWDTILTFTRVSDGRTFTTTIDSDGPTHAAEQAWKWWTVDAWRI